MFCCLTVLEYTHAIVVGVTVCLVAAGFAHKQPLNVREVAEARVQACSLLPTDLLVLWAGSPLPAKPPPSPQQASTLSPPGRR